MCRRRKDPYPWKVIATSEEVGVSEAKICKGKYEAELELPEGRGEVQPKNLPWGVWILTVTTQCRPQ